VEQWSVRHHAVDLDFIRSGSVSQATLNAAVSDILTEMFAFGLFDKPTAGSPAETATSAADQATALQIAEEGSVLLKNSGSVLPLSAAKDSSIAVIGGRARRTAPRSRACCSGPSIRPAT
jgi:beta-glucosidase